MTTSDDEWVDLGPVDQLKQRPLQQVTAGRTKLALSWRDGTFGAIHDGCNHVGGPLGQGTMDGDYVVCPWHHWKFHRVTGEGEPGYEKDCVPRYDLRETDGRLYVRSRPSTRRQHLPHAPHPLDRDPSVRAPGPLRILGVSTTAMDPAYPRYSTSEALLETALQHAREHYGLEAEMLAVRDLKFRSCEGYYSKSARACTWPCSITQMDPKDEMATVYERIVFWADVVIFATPIRWGAASSLWFKMAERLNTVQNQVTLRDRVMLKDKVAGLIVTGGQDNVQAVVGQMLCFLGELGYQFPQFPFVAHSRGWSAEDMERNIAFVQQDKGLHDGSRALLDRCLTLASQLQSGKAPTYERGGRKASGGDGPADES